MKKTILVALMFFVVMAVITGVAYPLAMTGVSQLLFHDKANGSVIEINGVKYGSELLGQQFTENKYLWGRIMNIDTETFVTQDGRPAAYSAPSNLSPKSEELDAVIKERVQKLKEADPENNQPVPVDLVTCSGSGLDPEISPLAAEYQVPRIAKERNLSEEEVRNIIKAYTKGKTFGIMGEERVNVLKVNLALDGIL